MNKWLKNMEKANIVPLYDGMTKHQIWEHEKWLDRQISKQQRQWRQVKSIRLLLGTGAQGVHVYQLYGLNGTPAGRVKWTPFVAYSLARQYKWKVRKPAVDTVS